MVSLTNNQNKSEEEKDSAMAALMRSTDEEIETNNNLSEMSQKARERAKKETVLKFEELFEK